MRDWIVDQVKELQTMISDETVEREQLLNRIADIVCVLEPSGKEEKHGQ